MSVLFHLRFTHFRNFVTFWLNMEGNFVLFGNLGATVLSTVFVNFFQMYQTTSLLRQFIYINLLVRKFYGRYFLMNCYINDLYYRDVFCQNQQEKQRGSRNKRDQEGATVTLLFIILQLFTSLSFLDLFTYREQNNLTFFCNKFLFLLCFLENNLIC